MVVIGVFLSVTSFCEPARGKTSQPDFCKLHKFIAGRRKMVNQIPFIGTGLYIKCAFALSPKIYIIVSQS